MNYIKHLLQDYFPHIQMEFCSYAHNALNEYLAAAQHRRKWHKNGLSRIISKCKNFAKKTFLPPFAQCNPCSGRKFNYAARTAFCPANQGFTMCWIERPMSMHQYSAM